MRYPCAGRVRSVKVRRYEVLRPARTLDQCVQHDHISMRREIQRDFKLSNVSNQSAVIDVNGHALPKAACPSPYILVKTNIQSAYTRFFIFPYFHHPLYNSFESTNGLLSMGFWPWAFGRGLLVFWRILSTDLKLI